MLRYLPLFAPVVRRLYTGLSDRWRRCALPAGAWLLLTLTMLVVLFTNDPPWPVSLHLLFVGSMI
jgi:hypothetical protein